MSVNKVILIGNLGGDPELSHTNSGTAFCKLSIATSERQKDANGEYKSVTSWHRVTAFGKQAENSVKYLTKGKQVYIEGKLAYGKYTDKEGIERYTTDILANNVTFLSGATGEKKPDLDPATVNEAAADFEKNLADDVIPF